MKFKEIEFKEIKLIINLKLTVVSAFMLKI